MMFERLEYEIENGDITATRVLGEEFFPCDDVILAIGQENAFPWIETRHRHRVRQMERAEGRQDRPFNRRRAGVFFGGDAAFGPKNIIWSVEHGHQAAISIHKFCNGEPVRSACRAA